MPAPVPCQNLGLRHFKGAEDLTSRLFSPFAETSYRLFRSPAMINSTLICVQFLSRETSKNHVK